MIKLGEAVIRIILTDDKENNVHIEFDNGEGKGNVPVDAVIAALEVILDDVKRVMKPKDKKDIN